MIEVKFYPFQEEQASPIASLHYASIHVRLDRELPVETIDQIIDFDRVYTNRKGEKIVSARFVASIVRHWGYDLYVDEPGDLERTNKLMPFIKVNTGAVVRDHQRAFWAALAYDAPTPFYQSGNDTAPEAQYDVIYRKRKEGKRLTRTFLANVVKSWGYAVHA